MSIGYDLEKETNYIFLSLSIEGLLIFACMWFNFYVVVFLLLLLFIFTPPIVHYLIVKHTKEKFND